MKRIRNMCLFTFSKQVLFQNPWWHEMATESEASFVSGMVDDMRMFSGASFGPHFLLPMYQFLTHLKMTFSKTRSGSPILQILYMLHETPEPTGLRPLGQAQEDSIMKDQLADNFHCWWSTCIRKLHQLSQVFSADVYMVICCSGQILVYKSNENAAWPPSEAEMVGDQLWVNRTRRYSWPSAFRRISPQLRFPWYSTSSLCMYARPSRISIKTQPSFQRMFMFIHTSLQMAAISNDLSDPRAVCFTEAVIRFCWSTSRTWILACTSPSSLHIAGVGIGLLQLSSRDQNLDWMMLWLSIKILILDCIAECSLCVTVAEVRLLYSLVKFCILEMIMQCSSCVTATKSKLFWPLIKVWTLDCNALCSSHVTGAEIWLNVVLFSKSELFPWLSRPSSSHDMSSKLWLKSMAWDPWIRPLGHFTALYPAAGRAAAGFENLKHVCP